MTSAKEALAQAVELAASLLSKTEANLAAGTLDREALAVFKTAVEALVDVRKCELAEKSGSGEESQQLSHISTEDLLRVAGSIEPHD